MLFLLLLIVAVAAFFIARKPLRESGLRWVAFLVIAAALLGATAETITVVPAGHVGIVDLFGNVSSGTLKPGINFVNPLADVINLSVKTRELKEVADVPSKEGLSVQLEISALFHLNPELAAEVYKKVGENYVDVIVIPYFRSVTRGVTSEYDAKALYTSDREVVARKIQSELAKIVEPRGITIESTPLRRVVLPKKVTDAIEDKLRSEQESQRMEFVLSKEQQEAERKRIEAQGIADFQRIVSLGLNDNMLKWKGIEATEKLAESANAKVVVIGAGKDGLPLILGGAGGE